MGVADFPIEFLRALKITPSGQSPSSHVEQARPSADSSTTNNSMASVHSKSSTTSLVEGTSLCPESTIVPPAADPGQAEHANITAEPQSMLRGRDSDQSPALSPSSTSDHRSLLGRAIRRSSSRSRSPNGNSRTRSQGHASSPSHPEKEGSQMSLESALHTGKGVGRIVGVGLKSPMDFTMSLARGFHNAPKLYGDESVRQTEKITGIQSGLKAAGKVSALFRQSTRSYI